MNCSVRLGDDENMMMSKQRQTEVAESKLPIIDAVKSLFSLPTTKSLFSLPTTSDSWILKVKALFQQGWPYFPPPNFEGGSGGDEGMMGNEGATVKVKDAVVKSLDKSKATVEDSARSAAKLADEAVDKTVKKLKKTLSGRGEERVPADHEAEL
ncbi:hypothetical protein Pfo_019825 [Paulownia fortunei]|nr:hypothetical protein Pfo_019825 [Paulownia fortunei]